MTKLATTSDASGSRFLFGVFLSLSLFLLLFKETWFFGSMESSRLSVLFFVSTLRYPPIK
jgi:hypothetical protein